MKKIIQISIALFLVLVAGAVVVYAAAPSNSPFGDLSALTAAIDRLTTALNNIQSIPGPQGEQGPVGPQGPAGSKGADGATVHLGQWQVVNVDPTDTQYISEPVATDGFVTATCDSRSPNTRAEIAGFEVLDNGNREVLITASKCPENSLGSFAGITMPVRKGNQYRINWLCSDDVTIKWWPLTA